MLHLRQRLKAGHLNFQNNLKLEVLYQHKTIYIFAWELCCINAMIIFLKLVIANFQKHDFSNKKYKLCHC